MEENLLPSIKHTAFREVLELQENHMEIVKKEIEQVLKTKKGDTITLDSLPYIDASNDIPADCIEKIRDAVSVASKIPVRYLTNTNFSGIPSGSIFILGNNSIPDLK